MSSSDGSIDHRSEILNNFFLLLKKDSFDVKIILSDGNVVADSAILCSASDYFANMLSNDKFVEGKTHEVPMQEYGTKEAMEQVVHYISSGVMDMRKIGLETMIEMMNISRMMLMRTDSLFASLEAHIISRFTLSSSFSRRQVAGVLFRGFMLVEKYRLDSLRKHFVNAITAAIWFSDGKFKDEDVVIIQQLKVKMITEIMLYEYDPVDPTVARLQFFKIWYVENKDCKDEEIKIIRDSINLDDFTGEELLTVVKESGLFPEKDIDKKCIERFKRLEPKKW